MRIALTGLGGATVTVDMEKLGEPGSLVKRRR